LSTITDSRPLEAHHRMIRSFIASVLCWLMLASAALATDSRHTEVEVRRAVLVTAAGERPVDLPHRLERGDYPRDGGRVRYRLEIDLPAPPQAPLGVFLRKLSLSASLAVNGRPAGVCGTGPLEDLRCLHRPQLFIPPIDVWQTGANTIEFELFANDRQMNGLGAVFIDDARVLDQSRYRTRLLWQVESIHALTWTTLTLAVYLWFGIAGLANAASNLNVLVTMPPVGFELFSWFVFAIRMASVALMQLMLLSFFGKATTLRRRVFLGYALAAPVLLWFLGSERWLVVGLYVPMQLTSVALMVGMLRWARASRRWSDVVMTLIYIVTFALGQLDFARLGGVGAFEGVYLMVYASAAMAAVIGATLVGLLASSLETSRRLTATLDREVAVRTADLEQANARLAELSMTDGLTGIANRRRFDEALSAEWKRARREGHPVSLILIDVDHFKHYNDTLGHLAGDDCLKRIARTLREHAARPADLVARYGGEEFALLTPENAESALRLGELLRDAVFSLALPHPDAPERRVTISVGVATLVPLGGETPADLVLRADEALYAAKRGGRNRVEVAGNGPPPVSGGSPPPRG
jgi:diguanylate cyclase (GGDEF)-like protein